MNESFGSRHSLGLEDQGHLTNIVTVSGGSIGTRYQQQLPKSTVVNRQILSVAGIPSISLNNGQDSIILDGSVANIVNNEKNSNTPEMVPTCSSGRQVQFLAHL